MEVAVDKNPTTVNKNKFLHSEVISLTSEVEILKRVVAESFYPMDTTTALRCRPVHCRLLQDGLMVLQHPTCDDCKLFCKIPIQYCITFQEEEEVETTFILSLLSLTFQIFDGSHSNFSLIYNLTFNLGLGQLHFITKDDTFVLFGTIMLRLLKSKAKFSVFL